MNAGHFSLILLPTLKCNADCAYCFENKIDDCLTLDQLSTIIRKVADHMGRNHIDMLSIYWQGGEVMTLPPEWFEQAYGIIRRVAEAGKIQVFNYIQSNMIGYTSKWNDVISEMFGNSVGSSLDFPNLHRRLKGGGPEAYDTIWIRKVVEAREAGIEVGIISIPNERTLETGAERFYSRIVDELGIRDFQINTPFPGGEDNMVKSCYPLNTGQLSHFLMDLADIWMDRGIENGVKIGPFDMLVEFFLQGKKDLLCIWRDNCVNDFICIDPRGYVSQCDCWVTSYPEFRFGNIFECDSLTDLLHDSEARRLLQARPGQLIQREECLDCDYLTLCHGGCPVRAYTSHGSLLRKDPYCYLYKDLFKFMERMAGKLARRRTSVRRTSKPED